MPVCEICGTDSPKAKRVFLEGSLLMLCLKCAKFGKESAEKEEVESKPAAPAGTPAPYTGTGRKGSDRSLDSGEVVLSEDYHKIISKARNKMGITQEELARKLNERKSVIAKLESKQLRPNDVLRKKLERVLHVVLTEKVQATGLQMSEGGRGVTIGDMIKMKKGK
jgi:putative transcription factor